MRLMPTCNKSVISNTLKAMTKPQNNCQYEHSMSNNCRHTVLNPVASAFPVACCGVSERMGNIIIPCGSKILRSLLRRASIML
jgi:hypothetical protein